MDQINEPTITSTSISQGDTTNPSSNQNPKDYFSRLFSGRINRKNFIVGMLLLLCFPIVLLIVDFSISLVLHFIFPLTPITNLSPGEQILSFTGSGNIVNSILTIIFTVLIIVWLIIFMFNFPALLIRRLHDLNKTGWLWFLWFVPFAGLGLLIYLLSFPGTNGENKYGIMPTLNRNIKQIFGFTASPLFNQTGMPSVPQSPPKKHFSRVMGIGMLLIIIVILIIITFPKKQTQETLPSIETTQQSAEISPSTSPIHFTFIKPTKTEKLCIGKQYIIKWKADKTVKNINLYLNTTPDANDASQTLWFDKPNELFSPGQLDKNGNYQGFFQWQVGKVLSNKPLIQGSEYNIGAQLHYKNGINQTDDQTYFTSDPFSISSCGNSPQIKQTVSITP